MESVGSTHQINDYTYSAEFKVASYRATGSDGAVAPPGPWRLRSWFYPALLHGQLGERMLELQAPRCIRVFLWSDGLGKKRKRKRRKKARGRRRATARLLFRKRGMLGFDFLSLQLIPDRSVQIHDYWYCCCSVDKMTHSSSNGCLVTVQILLCSGRLVPSCILKVYWNSIHICWWSHLPVV